MRVYDLYLDNITFIIGGFFLCYLLLKLSLRFFKIRKRIIFSSVFILFWACLAGGFLLWQKNKTEKNLKLEITQKISSGRDFVLEEKFSYIHQRMHKDTLLHSYLTQLQYCNTVKKRDSLEAFICSYIEGTYFISLTYHHSYISFCDRNEQLLLDENEVVDCEEYFQDKIETVGDETSCCNLYTIDYGLKYYAYLYKLCFGDSIASKPSMSIYVEMGRNKIADFNNPLGIKMPSHYSYALYVNNNMCFHKGDFLYDFKNKNLLVEEGREISTKRWSNYFHSIYKLPDNKSVFIISEAKNKFYQETYIFAVPILLYFLLVFLLELCFNYKALRPKTYSLRLQYTMFALVLCAFVPLGFISVLFMQDLNRAKSDDIFRDKVLAVLTNLENTDLKWDKDKWGNELKFLSNTYSLVINTFTKDGKLFISSNELFAKRDTCLLSLDSKIMDRLLRNESHLFMRDKTFMDYNVAIAYTPFRNVENEIIGFLTLTKLSPKDEYQSEFNKYLSAYFNILLLLCVLTFIVAYFLSNYITRPLNSISKHFRDVSIYKKNQHLEWKSEDEVGLLVERYNLLLDEIEISAHKLAESERETAWREMAKQVAHEIKNPLTPLKLQIQHLERAYKDKKEDFGERLSRTVSLLLNQIDLLSGIATTFSNFSKWHNVNMVEMPLKTPIENVCLLFQNYGVSINCSGQNLKVNADSNLLEQVLTNIVRNAVQALEEREVESPQISIECSEVTIGSTQKICISICDNAGGIAEEELDKIFEPHFTTKTKGTGLGLAISKKMLESMEGSMEVENNYGNGCCFRIYLGKF